MRPMPAIELTTGGYHDIPYREAYEGQGEAWRPDGPELQRRVKVPWASRREAVLDFVGWTSTGIDTAAGLLTRYPPHRHPWFPDFYCTEATLEGIIGVALQDEEGRYSVDLRGANGSLVENGEGEGDGWAVYRLTYRKPSFAMIGNSEVSSTELERYVFRREKATYESVTLPGQAFMFGGVGDPGSPEELPGTPEGDGVPADIANTGINGDTVMMLATGELNLEWYQIPESVYWGILRPKLLLAQGRVSSEFFDADRLNYPDGTLLFLTWDMTLRQGASEDRYVDLVLKFAFRKKGWNKIYSRAATAFFKVIDKKTGQRGIYETYDFNELFSFVA